MSGDDIHQGVLFGIGNPLLDISAKVDEELLKKYNLKTNDAILAEEKHIPLYDELSEKYKVDYIPGGATQNAIKVAQWILKKPNAASFTGCIKDDKYGKILNENCKKIGVNTMYQMHEGSEPTGLCAVLITGHDRSLVTNLGAANCFQEAFISKPEIWEHVEKAKFYYIAGFFLTVSPNTMLKIAEHSLAKKKTLVLNMSAPFLCQFFKDPMMKVMPYVDILMGNETEATTFSDVHEFGTHDLKEIAKRIAALPKQDAERKRIVIITTGAGPVIVVEDGSEPVEYPVAPLDTSKIEDTNGAGDAFAGGFLAQLVQQKPMKECIRCGIWAGNLIVQRSGCTFPETPDYS